MSGDDPSGGDGYVPVRWGHQVDLARVARPSARRRRENFEALNCKSNDFCTDFTSKPQASMCQFASHDVSLKATHHGYTTSRHITGHMTAVAMQSKARLCAAALAASTPCRWAIPPEGAQEKMTLAARASPYLTAGMQLSALFSNPTAEDSSVASACQAGQSLSKSGVNRTPSSGGGQDCRAHSA